MRGEAAAVAEMTPGQVQRFWSGGLKSLDGCLVWNGSLNSNGYGRFSIGGKLYLAHRVAVLLDDRPIPAGFEVDHLCKRKSCIEPSHLEPVTKSENMKRAGNQYSRREVCGKGHPLRGDNLGPRDYGRRCRTCQREAQRRANRKRRGTRTFRVMDADACDRLKAKP